jgi:hypothetical protein
MARRIRLDQIGDYSEEKLNQLMRVVVLETDGQLKAQSPVDTGRFRSSWIIGENGTQGAYDAGPGLGATPPKAANYVVGQEKFGENYHVHNSLPYAEALANGHSRQAPAGWIDIIARQMTARARQLADSIGRQD